MILGIFIGIIGTLIIELLVIAYLVRNEDDFYR
jgi:hypothetical protein